MKNSIMQCSNDELIAAGHELAKCLDNEPLLDIAKMIVRLADKLDVTTAALREKTKQCEQLAAENAALKDQRPNPHSVSMFEAIEKAEQLMDEGMPELAMVEAFEILKIKRTPATDAFLREVRAQGVEAYADSKYCQEESQSGAHEFAAQLRQGGAA